MRYGLKSFWVDRVHEFAASIITVLTCSQSPLHSIFLNPCDFFKHLSWRGNKLRFDGCVSLNAMRLILLEVLFDLFLAFVIDSKLIEFLLRIWNRLLFIIVRWEIGIVFLKMTLLSSAGFVDF